MIVNSINTKDIFQCCSFETLRSSGPGGQHVNKASTAVRLIFDIDNCNGIDDNVKENLRSLAKNKISNEGLLLIKSDESRSQYQNKQNTINRLLVYIRKASIRKKKRKITKPPKVSKQRRLDIKKQRSEIKKLRSKFKP